MTSEPPKHSASTVGSTFMRQYYHLLAKEPQSLHRFYKDESVWCHGQGSLMQEPVSGQQAIHDEILRRGYAGARVNLDNGSIDCQDSLAQGVFVLVTGVMTLASAPTEPRPFVQTFFLAVQPHGYFVLNDCLRFLELPNATAAPAPAVKAALAPVVADAPPTEAKRPTSPAAATTAPTKAKAVASPVKTNAQPAQKAHKADKPKHQNAAAPGSPKPKPAAAVASPVRSPVKAATPVTSPVKKVSSPTAKPATAPTMVSPVKAQPVETPAKAATAPPASPIKAAAPAATKTTSPPAATKATAPAKQASPVKAPEEKKPAGPPAQRSWAALFSGATEPAAAPVASVAPVQAVKSAAAPTAAAATAPSSAPAAVTATKSAAAPTSPKAKPAESATTVVQHERKRYFSLFIRDVPAQAKEGDVRELFQGFGTIANVSITIGRGFAFVDYLEEASMRAALAHDAEFKLFDRVLHVDERRDRDQRGGFRNDLRGRGRGHGPKGRVGDRRDRDDVKDRAPGNANGRSTTGPGASTGPATSSVSTGPRTAGADRRDKGGRRGPAGKDTRAE